MNQPIPKLNHMIDYHIDKRLAELEKPKRWNDKLVKEFALAGTKGQYGEMKGCKTMVQKLKRFKKINNIN